MEARFAVNAEAPISVIHVGDEHHPVVIVDDFLKDTQALIDLAGEGEGFVEDRRNYYPGIRRPLPEDYAAALAGFVDQGLRAPFDFDPMRQPNVILCALSIASRRPESLMPIQSIPHFDTTEAHQIAAVHYLCDPRLGGTSFYRHRSSGFCAITDARCVQYQKSLAREATTVGLPQAGYINGDTALFERVAAVGARFNRMVFYCSNLLHAGSIDGSALSADPRKGRLTATSFIRMDLA